MVFNQFKRLFCVFLGFGVTTNADSSNFLEQSTIFVDHNKHNGILCRMAHHALLTKTCLSYECNTIESQVLK